MHLHEINIRSGQFPTTDIYPFNLSVFHNDPRLVFDTPITFFVGENGSGKSTLLRAITRACGIHIWSQVEKRRFDDNPNENDLHKFIDVSWNENSIPGAFFSAELFNYFARSLDDWASGDPGLLEYFGGISLLSQSHGQSILSFLRSQSQRTGIYFLDEPETALSPTGQIGLLKLLYEQGKLGHAQWIIATHSPILLGCPGSCIYNFDTAPIHPTEYERTNHYTIYRDFLADRTKYLR